ncbi:type VI secretion system tip protein VgrG [Pedobacter sp. HMF7647]|uniref:Type VI secretion system tip protein VgrG n=1 Tax=Hufsiella arboris TaxID=2695275 RepID=A0A7K1Y5K8_9SPHI|nr:type VI secretion system tip protein VgrG [Hufsiella arboris]MXV49671.1 type VI secretion system tip protein VgrG [Hufsiella arboris]
MSEERLIPAVESVAEFRIKISGTEIPATVAKLGVHITKVVNKISSATLIFQDGDASDGKFPLTDGDLFTPGNEIVIEAGDPEKSTSIFTGIVIKQSIKVRSASAPQLIVECRHKAIKTTIGRKNAYFHDSTDSDIISQILQADGFNDVDIETSDLTHKEMVQYNTTDWDFILSRAEATGKVILTNDGKIETKTPTVTGDATLSLNHGDTLIELDAEMDSRNQFAAVKSKAWDMANQEIAESTANDPSDLEEEGILPNTDLAAVAGPEEFILSHSATLAPDERQAWADAQLLKSRLAKIRGKAKFQGIATINPGDVIQLTSLGDRFNGKAFVSGVRQEYTLTDGWKTHAQFGHTPDWFIEETQVTAPKAGGLLPGVIGLHTGIVTDNEDPENEQRVRVKMPFINADDDGVWARIALADAGNERGLFFRPDVGDEVVLGFLFDDPRYPVILGMLHSSNKVSPIDPTNDNFKKGYTSREKLKLTFDDEIKEILIETPGENKAFISDDKKGISLEDQSGHKITTEPASVTIKDSKDNQIHIDVNGGIIKIKGNSKVVVDAPQIELVDGAAHPLVFGDDLLTYLTDIVKTYTTHTHVGQTALGLPVSPMIPAQPMSPPTPALLSVKVKTG